MSIIYKSPDEIELLKEAGRIVATVLDALSEVITPGITTGELRDVADGMISEAGATAPFRTEAGFPASICTSINEQIVHGVPGSRELRDGDIVSIDVGARLNGYIGDSARTFPVGNISPESEKLIRVTRECLERAVEASKPGGHMSDIGRAVETHAEANGFSVVREFVGHGVGTGLHEPPQVPNYVAQYASGRDLELKPGLVIAIEPMLNIGTWQVKKLSDDWTVVTKDGKRSAHFENTIAVTEDGPVILTKS